MKFGKDDSVLVAVLDWGLGHATRSVPVIRKLQRRGCRVTLASAGRAKEFLMQYFPELPVIDKPAYNVSYSGKIPLALSIAFQTPKIIGAVIREHFWLKRLLSRNNFHGVISDNCYGLWNMKAHTIFITHQLHVECPRRLRMAGSLIDRIIHAIVRKYDECHVPDNESKPDYSGRLSHGHRPGNVRFIGIQSRFNDNFTAVESPSYDAVLLLSGPEPQRTILENKFSGMLSEKKIKACIVRGLPGTIEKKENTDHITWHNHLHDDELKSVLMNAKKIFCRSGYSTIMDLAELRLNAVLIPTPGQTEQEYLAGYNSGSQFKMLKQEEMLEAVL